MKKSPIYSPVVFAEVIACWNGFYMALENMWLSDVNAFMISPPPPPPPNNNAVSINNWREYFIMLWVVLLYHLTAYTYES
jgi:hypothetical protein